MCSVGVFRGEELSRYSFPRGHPLTSTRMEPFMELLRKEERSGESRVRLLEPVIADSSSILAFHTEEYVAFVRKASEVGSGYLDYGDTPAFPGVFEASIYVVGSTLLGLSHIMKGELEHVFNPMGGLHHARRDRAAGFCVFNDPAVAITRAKTDYHFQRILYVDIDAHHGDGVCYEFYDDPSVFVADIHEDGRYLYPGTGFEYETGAGAARGSKLNIPLAPNAGDQEFSEAFKRVEEFARKVEPEIIFLQAGADGLVGDPLTHLKYTEASHRLAAGVLHRLSHEYCKGRLVAMGGGGYNAANAAKAWMEVVRVLSAPPP